MPKFSKEGFWSVFRTGVLLRNPSEILSIIGKEAADNLGLFDLEGENREYEAQCTRSVA